MRKNKLTASSKDKEDYMSTKYVHFTDEQKELARQTDLCELLLLARRKAQTIWLRIRMVGRIAEGHHSGESVVPSVRQAGRRCH